MTKSVGTGSRGGGKSARRGADEAAERSSEPAPASRASSPPASSPPASPKKKHRGFRAMSPEKQREIASMGGRAVHAKGTGHEFTTEEAREAGRRGGQIAQQRRAAERAG